jgi:hypothetical protein
MTNTQSSLDSYQQALDDFGITQLLSRLSNYSDADFDATSMNLEQQELESLAAILIGQLTQTLNGKLIASYFNAIRQGNLNVFHCPINLEFAQSVDLPDDFPNKALPPQFLYGDKLRLVSPSSEKESGVVIGRFYNYASHRCCWMWHYILWLDPYSCSATWLVATTAWEEDLQPIIQDETL